MIYNLKEKRKIYFSLISLFIFLFLISSVVALEIGETKGSGVKIIPEKVTGEISNSTSNGTTYHNLLSGLQGGTASEYYHLTNAEWIARIFLFNQSNLVYNFNQSANSNSSWNEDYAYSLYCLRAGCTMAGIINMDGNEIQNILGIVGMKYFIMGGDINMSDWSLNNVSNITARNFIGNGSLLTNIQYNFNQSNLLYNFNQSNLDLVYAKLGEGGNASWNETRYKLIFDGDFKKNFTGSFKLNFTESFKLNFTESFNTNVSAYNSTLPWNTTGANIFTNNLNSKVGIGIKNPAVNLDINATSDPTIQLSEGGVTTSWTRFVDASPNQFILYKRANTGNVLIDISPLVVDGTGTASFRFFRDTTTTGLTSFTVHKGDGTSATNSLFAGNGNSYINALVGSVGIGTSTPTTLLHVSGTGNLLNISNSSTTIMYANNTAVGIGTNAPITALQVEIPGTGGVREIVRIKNGEANGYGGIGIDASGSYYGTGIFSLGNMVMNAESSGSILIGKDFVIRNSISSNGLSVQNRTSIGALSSGAMLNVNGTGDLLNITNSSTAIFRVNESAIISNQTLWVQGTQINSTWLFNQSNTDWFSGAFQKNFTDSFKLNFTDSFKLNFTESFNLNITSYNKTMIWNQSGTNIFPNSLANNVGIGTKSIESWGINYPTIQVGAKGAIIGHNSNTGLYLIDNLYYDGTDWRQRTDNQNGSYISQYLGDISFNFADGSGGLADDIVTGLAHIVIKNSGKVGIGTSNPAYNLEIKNSSKVLNASGNLYVNDTAITFSKDTYLGNNVAHGQIDWLYNPTSATDGTTFCNYYDSQITGISYTCVDCVNAGDGTSLDCDDTTVDKNCACQVD